MKHFIRITFIAAAAAAASLAMLSQPTSARMLAVPPQDESSCLFCAQAVPECPKCAMNEECVVTKSTCTECATAQCQAVKTAPPKEPASECLMCSQAVPECPKCAMGQECVVTKSSCSQCATAQCKDIMLSIPEKNEEMSKVPQPDEEPATPDNCIRCFAPVTCPRCANDEYCQKERASCTSCGHAYCVKLRRLPASAVHTQRPSGESLPNKQACVNCLVQPRCPKCAQDEQCELTVQDCDNCSTAECVPISKHKKAHGSQ
ncbi:hypothetical protein SYNPS1DRAFT_26326 [Syncephalis pseudoplumigaleata]|uniref:Membrane anchor Opy2 N-terminal domain-containing protein n=1 Tax=Syncephalis pseudoplumigaleata TaxID=1712513 RepID=A0A4V1J2C4_9FUNG|nr:hypothetical protein SYNPS1DRAFT_26326 [Syncephalis pseudoplumigaleata]|eukprot:RKP28069.1 hypothetical protein SYNPS1DRAFT_26326 [Syncephalis pseudoplumigaleata]